MTGATILVLLSTLCLMPKMGFAAVKAAKTSHSNKTAIKAKSKAGVKTAAKPTTSTASRNRANSSGATHLVRTKSGRLVRVKTRVPPAPTFQTHPDPDRYAEIQRALIDRGFFKGEPNGQWGDDSVDALKRFQAGSNLPDDGKISALTLSGLGLGPRHDGSTASTVPLPSAPSATAPTVVEGSVGPAASAPVPTSQSPAPQHPPER